MGTGTGRKRDTKSRRLQVTDSRKGGLSFYGMTKKTSALSKLRKAYQKGDASAEALQSWLDSLWKLARAMPGNEKENDLAVATTAVKEGGDFVYDLVIKEFMMEVDQGQPDDVIAEVLAEMITDSQLTFDDK
jgi:hypothetical protein